MIKHWNEPRGVGGIFFDDLNTENWQKDFTFVKSVGKAFLDTFSAITKHHMKNHQLSHIKIPPFSRKTCGATGSRKLLKDGSNIKKNPTHTIHRK